MTSFSFLLHRHGNHLQHGSRDRSHHISLPFQQPHGYLPQSNRKGRYVCLWVGGVSGRGHLQGVELDG